MDEYRWRSEDSHGEPVESAPSPAFPSQADAEAWLSESWEELADAGVAAVTLMCHEDVVYGPMSLAAI